MKPKKTLLEHAHAERGDEAVASLSEYFNRMSMPLPMFRECRPTADGGYLIFMNDYGVAMRITYDKFYPLHRHGRMLQPLASKRIGIFRFDINPGIHVSGDSPVPDSNEYKDFECLFEELYRDGIVYEDKFKWINFGTLPGSYPNWVVVDAGSLRKVGHAWIKSILEKYQHATPPDIQQRLVSSEVMLAVQDDLYKHLRRQFNEAWPQSSEYPLPQALKSFWLSCKAEKDAGSLLTSWPDDRDDYLEAFQGKYSQRFYDMQ